MDVVPEKLHFHRYEFKYLVSGDRGNAVVSALERRMERDSHSAPDGSYHVRSMYFDTADFAYHREKESGQHSRHKFRIRSYGTDACSPVFLELKGKHDCLVYKHRQSVEENGLGEALEAGTGALCDFITGSGCCNGVGLHFAADCFRRRLSPSLVVDYRRTAFENRANPDFRATLDTGVRAWRARRNGAPTGIPRDLSPCFSVLEIKFRYRLPSWFHRLAQNLDLDRVSYSKFHRAGERLWMNDASSLLDRMIERGRSWPL
jgi:hypothetical protein